MAARSPDPLEGQGAAGSTVQARSDQLALELGHTPSHALNDFIAGEGNRLAVAHLLAFPAWPHPITLLLGPPQSGKSHLARVWAEQAGAAFAGPEQIVASARSADRAPLVLEDVDRMPYGEDALFHLLNGSMRGQRAMLLTARLPVAQWPYRTEDVRSRARLATSFTIAPPADAELSQILAKLFGDRQIAVDPKVIAYLVARMERSTEEIAALADLLDRLALAHGTAITRRIAAEALHLRRLARGETVGALSLEGDDDERDE